MAVRGRHSVTMLGCAGHMVSVATECPAAALSAPMQPSQQRAPETHIPPATTDVPRLRPPRADCPILDTMPSTQPPVGMPSHHYNFWTDPGNMLSGVLRSQLNITPRSSGRSVTTAVSALLIPEMELPLKYTLIKDMTHTGEDACIAFESVLHCSFLFDPGGFSRAKSCHLRKL